MRIYNYCFKMSKIFLISKKIWCLCGGGCSISFHNRCVSTVCQCKSFSLWLNKSSSEHLFTVLSLINSIDPNCLSSYAHVLKSQVNFNYESSNSFKRPGIKPHIAILRLRRSINLDIKPNFEIHTCLHHPSLWNSTLYGPYNKNTEIYMRI